MHLNLPCLFSSTEFALGRRSKSTKEVPIFKPDGWPFGDCRTKQVEPRRDRGKAEAQSKLVIRSSLWHCNKGTKGKKAWKKPGQEKDRWRGQQAERRGPRGKGWRNRRKLGVYIVLVMYCFDAT